MIKLIIGDKNFSSWSMRGWLAVKLSGLPFEEILIRLDQPESHLKIREYSPSGKVPCLIDGSTKVWDSLAICEYAAEKAPEKNLWPKDQGQRATARSYVAEMHSGFVSLRQQLSMDLQLKTTIHHLLPGTIDDIQRILHLWSTALKDGGPFLFGEFGIVDAFYAPVVFRFISYGITIKDTKVLNYMKKVKSHPVVKAWVDGGLNEKPYEFKF